MKKILILTSLLFSCALILSCCNEAKRKEEKNVVIEGYESSQNLDLFEKFYSDVENKEKSKVDIVTRGKHGVDLKVKVTYEDNKIFVSRSDDDGYTEKFSCEKIFERIENEEKKYYVSECKGKTVNNLNEIQLLDTNTKP